MEEKVNRVDLIRRYTFEHNDISSTRYLGEACVSSGSCRRGVRDSVCHYGVCTCLPFHVAQNATTCLPSIIVSCLSNHYDNNDQSFMTIIAALLGFECFAHSQCSLRVPNSGCIDGSCQCSKGYSPYRRHLCLPRESISVQSSSEEKNVEIYIDIHQQPPDWVTNVSAMINADFLRNTLIANSLFLICTVAAIATRRRNMLAKAAFSRESVIIADFQ